jgi:hypothetical protein
MCVERGAPFGRIIGGQPRILQSALSLVLKKGLWSSAFLTGSPSP